MLKAKFYLYSSMKKINLFHLWQELWNYILCPPRRILICGSENALNIFIFKNVIIIHHCYHHHLHLHHHHHHHSHHHHYHHYHHYHHHYHLTTKLPRILNLTTTIPFMIFTAVIIRTFCIFHIWIFIRLSVFSIFWYG